ncbi:NOT4_1 [Blepharisma stoltei]|uniref:C3H1-type domain-containing protein n=1 Tax=Blepharisma stoltei TaxID=1481888 RepID=A0AAU9IDJ4_9CILI|nr:unnamed protein product [Blepharisma stoltei]
MSMDKFFGQYGRIKKCVVNKANAYTNPSGLSYSAYLTYHSEVEATLCIKACDGFVYEEREIKATYGTTKYCNSYVKGTRCQNPDCMYLHEEGSLSDTFTREDIQHNCHIQAHNSIFPLLNVIAAKPDKHHVLPSARVQRARISSEEFQTPKTKPRVSSEEFQTPPKTKPRVYSFDFAPRRLHSRFNFVEESNEDAIETPEFLRKILALNSPTQEIVKLPATEVPKLLRNSWVKDLLQIEEAQFKSVTSQRDEIVLASSKAWT